MYIIFDLWVIYGKKVEDYCLDLCAGGWLVQLVYRLTLCSDL